MKKQTKRLWLLGGAAALTGAVLLLSFLSARRLEKVRATEAAAETGAAFDAVPLSDFTLTSASGSISLYDLEGTPLVVHFFSPGTEPGEELMLLNSLAAQYNEKLLFLPVCEAGELAAAEALFAANGISLPLYADASPSAKEACAVTQVPSTVFIDDGGFSAARSQGAIDEEAMLFGISLIAPKD